MSARRIAGVQRGIPMTLVVDGEELPCFGGETIAAAMLAAGRSTFRSDTQGNPRGMFCNMGSCGECTVTLVPSGRRVRACLTDVADALEISTHG